MLTRTEGTFKEGFNSTAKASNHSTSLAQQENGGEFEKRITDIKMKLSQIKNTINNEIETSYHQINQGKEEVVPFKVAPTEFFGRSGSSSYQSSS